MGQPTVAKPHLVRLLARQRGCMRRRTLRPLVLGPAILHRQADTQGPWRIDLADDQALIPHVPECPHGLRRVIALHEALGHTARVALALASPGDASGHRRLAGVEATRGRGLSTVPEIYGWSIMYRLPHQRFEAFIDPHDDHADLPAFYESPLELLDRTAFLAAKRIAHRVLALVTQPEDFEKDGRRKPGRNRFYPHSRFGRPADLTHLA